MTSHMFKPTLSYLDETNKKTRVIRSDIGSSAVILDANLSMCTPNRLWLSSKYLKILKSQIIDLINSGNPSSGPLCRATI